MIDEVFECLHVWTAGNPPCSFRYDGRDSGMGEWACSEKTDEADGGRITRYTYRDAAGLRAMASVRSFDAFPAFEWMLEFANDGEEDTPILADILPLDLMLPLPAEATAILHHAKGSLCAMDDFLPLATPLPPGAELALAPDGGRSSDGVLPFMNLQTGDGGVVLAIGWSGQWQATVQRDEQDLRLTAGMQRTHLRLHPGERIRTPRILLIRWSGDDPLTGSNLLRRVILAHYTPRPDGENALPPVAYNSMYAHYLDNASLSLSGELKAVEIGHALGLEAHWVDACWFANGNWVEEVGDWSYRQTVFPDGLAPLADAAHARGMRFILWFEPERVCKGTSLAVEHPEWVLQHDGGRFLLFNLGIPEARSYLTDLISRIITESHVDVYRQDFNIAPLPFWQGADAPDRVGMTEIRHIEGLYAFWDELRRRHPGLTIDNCASGGRRIDLETTARSYPLWRSDFTDVTGLEFGRGLHIGAQCETAGLSRWVPLHAAAVWGFTPYEFRSAMSSGVILYSDIREDAFPHEAARQAIAELKRLRPYFLGNFYPLLSLTAKADDWCAYQFHRPDLQAGFAVYLRRHESPYLVMQAMMKALDPAARYAVRLCPTFESAPEVEMTGAALAALPVRISECPGSLLIEYRQVASTCIAL
ncbi:MAG: glycoside hydrolase family 36 protein [Armatimonadota bacterium]